MAMLDVIIIGPCRGGTIGPRRLQIQAATVSEALAAADDEPATEDSPAHHGGAGHGGVAFLNGADVRLNGPADRAVRAGDVLTVIRPSTDT